ncbi:hypothetical protein D3C85_1608840 [compost metagenome]
MGVPAAHADTVQHRLHTLRQLGAMDRKDHPVAAVGQGTANPRPDLYHLPRNAPTCFARCSLSRLWLLLLRFVVHFRVLLVADDGNLLR